MTTSTNPSPEKERPTDERCWFHVFLDDPCPERAAWYWPDAPNSTVRAMRWCAEHKNDNCVRIPR